MIRETDMKLIRELRDNARESLTNISRKTRIPISTLYDRLKQHADSLFLKHTTLLDFAKFGYYCRANIMLSINKVERDRLCAYLKAHDSINNLYKINNGYDLLAEGVFRNVKDMEDFMEELESRFNLTDKRNHYIIEDLKREAFLAKDHFSATPSSE